LPQRIGPVQNQAFTALADHLLQTDLKRRGILDHGLRNGQEPRR
jgi:hypothetical protein